MQKLKKRYLLYVDKTSQILVKKSYVEGNHTIDFLTYPSDRSGEVYYTMTFQDAYLRDLFFDTLLTPENIHAKQFILGIYNKYLKQTTSSNKEMDGFSSLQVGKSLTP